ncbi:MAG: hypothetical protein DRJ15_12935 [Bacteroidetes bacterium]|nr:MAG: hypothetical protein DRJ15_12935 [Bacteroidota bacterium]
MPAFLEKLTKHIYTNWGDRLGDICIVLPNRRAALFIKDHLAKILKKTSFLPEFYSIEDFVAHCSGLTITDPLRDQFTLYALHRDIEGDQARSIEEFFPYASWMLSDFNEIDMYLVGREQLFNYLSDAKAMAMWNPDGRPLSDFEKRYLRFFRSLKQYYYGLNEMLSGKDMAYQGGAFRQLAEDIENSSEAWPWEKVIFAGFNALTPSEEKIVKHLLKTGRAEVYWDADKYYTDNPVQEAGTFLRRYFKDFGDTEPLWKEDNYAQQKEVHIIGVPKNTGQLKYAGELLLKQLKEKGSLDSTALVLPDESLLLPMLNSIPEEAGKFNVTMGLALKNTPLFSLLDAVLSIHHNAERFSQMREGRQRAYYSKDLLDLVKHPWFGMLSADISEKTHGSLEDMIRKSNRIFFPATDIVEILKTYIPEPAISNLFPSDPGPLNVLASLSGLLTTFRQKFIDLRKDGSHDLGVELEYLFRFSNLLQRLQELVQTYKSIDTLRTLQMIFRQLSGQERIAFRGEPLQGLQIMGMLETRTLDFDTVIMLSANEGILPAAKMPNSFIPYDMKQEFGLPTYRHNNTVFAYHFYRLLQRAGDVYLLYNTEGGPLGGGEKSRFITQLQHEGPKYNPGIHITEKLLSMPPQPGIRDTAIVINKDESVLRLLQKEAKKGFHPSSLNIYINCPLQFYLSRLIRVEESDDIEETIDARTMGIVIHEALRVIIGGHLHRPLDKGSFQQFKKIADAEIKRQFGKYYHEDDISYGKNYLIVNVALNMLKQLFDREAAWLDDGEELFVTALEEGLSTSVQIKGENNISQINFKGTIDRIDSKAGKVRILDYKTGGVVAAKLKPETWEVLFTDPEYSQALQLMMYAWLFHKNHTEVSELEAGIISLRAPGRGPVMMHPPDRRPVDTEVLEEFEDHLMGLLMEIVDPDIPFAQTEDESRCKYCSFKTICNKTVSNFSY